MCHPISTICCLSFSRYSTQQTWKPGVYYPLPHVCALVLQCTVYVLCQNAMRATVETHETSPTLPPIKVRVSLGAEDLTIKVGDDTDSYDRPQLCTGNWGETGAEIILTNKYCCAMMKSIWVDWTRACWQNNERTLANLTYLSLVFRCLTKEVESPWGRLSVCSATCTPRLPVQST